MQLATVWGDVPAWVAAVAAVGAAGGTIAAFAATRRQADELRKANDLQRHQWVAEVAYREEVKRRDRRRVLADAIDEVKGTRSVLAELVADEADPFVLLEVGLLDSACRLVLLHTPAVNAEPLVDARDRVRRFNRMVQVALTANEAENAAANQSAITGESPMARLQRDAARMGLNIRRNEILALVDGTSEALRLAMVKVDGMLAAIDHEQAANADERWLD